MIYYGAKLKCSLKDWVINLLFVLIFFKTFILIFRLSVLKRLELIYLKCY